MRKLLRSIVDIRKGELGVTLLMVFNLYVLMVAYYFLKPARDSLFLSKLGADQLPYVFILTAFVIVPITTLYSKASRTVKLNRLITISSGIVVASLFVLRYMMTLQFFWIPYLFYIWVSIFGVMMTSQFWLLANAVYDAAQAKRLFALLGLAGILGAWTGGEVTSLIVATFKVQTEDLLIFCVGLTIASAVIANVVWRRRALATDDGSRKARSQEQGKSSFGQLFGTITRSRHLLMLVGIITVTMMVASLVDFQFKTMTVQSIPDKAELTAFLGKFYGRLSAVSFLLQLVLTYRFIRVIGVGGSILLLPLGLTLGTMSLFLFPGLIAAVMLRGADGALKYSIDKTGRELLFLPVPLEVKKRTKVFIDMFVDRWARGVAGGLLLLLIYLFDFESDAVGAVRSISLVVMGFLAVWIAMALIMRKEYVNTFRTAIEKREIDLSEVRININEPSTVDSLIPSLSSTNERQVVYALTMLTGLKSDRLIEPVVPLLNHKSADVRLHALKLLHDAGNEELLSEVKVALKDEDSRVGREAVRFMIDYSGGESEKLLAMLLNQPDPVVCTAALSYIAEYGQQGSEYLIHDEIILNLLNDKSSEGTEGRALVARTLGGLDPKLARKYIKRVFHDSEPSVVSAAMWSIGKQRFRDMVPSLIDKLGEKRYRADARNAIRAFGTAILGTLADYLNDENVSLLIRRNIPRVLATIPDQTSVAILTGSLEDAEPSLRYHIVKGLNRLHREYPELIFAREQVNTAMIAETRSYYRIQQVLQRHRDSDDAAAKLLNRALVERQDLNLEQIFRLLGLHYRTNDIYGAYQGLIGNQRQRRASAIEFLDNLLKSDVKKFVLPIIDEVSPEATARKGTELFGIKIDSAETALAELIEGRDSWLKACAVYCVMGKDSPRLMELVEKAREDKDSVVREAADMVVRKRYG